MVLWIKTLYQFVVKAATDAEPDVTQMLTSSEMSNPCVLHHIFRRCQIVLITLPSNGSLLTSAQYTDDFSSYHEAKAASHSSSYIAAEFDVVDFETYKKFTVGNGGVTSGVVGMSNYGAAVRKYFNGPLSSGSMYTVFQRFYTDQVGMGLFM